MIKFFVKKDNSLESEEIVKIIESQKKDWEWLVCKKDETNAFYQSLAELVRQGITPVLVGRKCLDENGGFFNLSLKVPEGVVLLLETQQDKELIRQVAKLLDYSLTPQQKLLGYMNRMTFAEMRNKGYAADEIIAAFDDQFLKRGGTRKEIYKFRKAVEDYSGRFPLVELTIESPKLLELVPPYVGELSYYSGHASSVLVSFENEKLPVLVSRSIPSIVKKSFVGHSENGVFYLDAGSAEEFKNKVRKVYC